MNLFSQASECREYIGEAWTEEKARDDCAGQEDSTYRAQPCARDEILGSCLIDGESSQAYDLFFPGTDEANCQNTVLGCEVFAGGRFSPSPLCEGRIEPPAGIGTEGDVFQPPQLLCSEDDEGGERCLWEAIGGCAKEGELFADNASCEPVWTQRPYIPVGPSGFTTPADDPIRANEGFIEELEWARAQGKSCGCVCCHAASVSPPGGAAVWDLEQEGIWSDGFTDDGLAMAAGWVDSSALGAFAAADNNGFDRDTTVMPTTDIARMIRFFEGELARRGLQREDFADAPPAGGPIYRQRLYEPEECEEGNGIDSDGLLRWSGGGARYLYLLEEDSENPSSPPNLDLPAGTLWRVDVAPSDMPIEDGIRYGELPSGTSQRFPEEGAPEALRSGGRYYLYVLKDMGVPITRCLFRAP